jgi:hypothetical protein
MLGGTGEPIEREGITFHPRSPKLRTLSELVAKLEKMEANTAEIDIMIDLLTYVLYIEEGGKKRRATFDEIADTFDMKDLPLIKELIQEYAGFATQASSAGN